MAQDYDGYPVADLEKINLQEAADWLRIVLPMAKGYAAQHKVGSNARYIEGAEAALAALADPS
jgi:hypothetical protein